MVRERLAQGGYFDRDPGWTVFDTFFRARCVCEEDSCWCTILTAPRKGHLIKFFIKLWRA